MDIPFAARLLAWQVRREARRRPVRPLSELELGQVRRVLLVLTTGIGDAIFSSAVFASVRAALPQAEIALFCRRGWEGLFAADPSIDAVIPYHGKFRKFFPTLRALQAFAPDLALVLHGNDPDIIPLCYLAGGRFIIRIPTTGTAFSELLSNRIRAADATTVPGLHYVDNRLRILDTLGIPVVGGSPEIHLDPQVLGKVAGKLAGRFSGRPYWVLHVHAADAYKSLPPELARALVEEGLRRFPENDLVLSGGPENRAALLSLVPESRRNRVFIAAGEFGLTESAACLAGAAAVIAPDTGILHLAAALDRPVIGLFAPTRAALVGPRPPRQEPLVLEKPLTCDPCLQKKCPHRPVKCMGQFDAESILTALATRLSP